MEYQMMGNKLIVRLDPKDEIVESVRNACIQNDIKAAEVRGLGAVDCFDIGLYDLRTKQFIPSHYEEPAEIVSLWGDIGENEGEIYHHLHIACGLSNASVVGGHLIRAVISATAEIVIEPLEGRLLHRVNPITGLNELDFRVE